MDDFLHNLRSGKLKQGDRSNRSYNDPYNKGGQRRMPDRRKRELETFERLNAVKEVLVTISETQKRMADAYEARTKAEERKARAMEVLAQNLYRTLNPGAKGEELSFTSESDKDPDPPAMEEIAPSPKPTAQAHKKPAASAEQTPKKLTPEIRLTLYKMIAKMRDEGNGWESIARHIASQGYPTASGKGIWRGITAKNLYDKMASKK